MEEIISTPTLRKAKVRPKKFPERRNKYDYKALLNQDIKILDMKVEPKRYQSVQP